MLSDPNEKVEIKVGPVWAKFNEHKFLTIILVLLCAFGLVYFLHKHDQSTDEGLNQVTRELKRLQETQSETTYVLTLSQEERAKLALRMPESLRKKIRGDYTKQ